MWCDESGGRVCLYYHLATYEGRRGNRVLDAHCDLYDWKGQPKANNHSRGECHTALRSFACTTVDMSDPDAAADFAVARAEHFDTTYIIDGKSARFLTHAFDGALIGAQP
jgi:hypothetical protein